MKISFFPLVFGCGDLVLDIENLKEPECSNGKCVLECNDGYISHFHKRRVHAECHNGTWTYPDFGCCEKPQ